MKLAILALAIGFAMPAYAQSTTEYYIVRDATTKKCTIVDHKPAASTTTTIVDGNKVYKTRTEADAVMKTVKVCTTE